MKQLLFLSTVILFTCGECKNFPESVHRLRVRNNSSQIISVFACYILPDTILPIQKPEMKIISSGEFKDIYDNDIGDDNFERFFNNEELTVFVLSTDTIEKYQWEIVQEKYIILKRLEILPDDLEEYGSISYP